MGKKWLVVICFSIVSSLLVDQLMAQGRGKRQGGGRNSGQGQQGEGSQKKKGRFGQGNGARTGQGQNANSGRGGGTLTAKDTESLIQMREEEKLARDVYSALYSTWGDKVFSNIAGAESRHMMAVGNLLSKFGIEDPIKNQAPGIFTDPKLQELYNKLVAAGNQSLQAALSVGLQIEEMDIADLKTSLAATSNADIQRVLENLMRGSESHLRAFASRLSAEGGSYTAQHLTQKEMDQILNSRGSRGRGNGPRSGSGNQQGTKRGNGKGNQQGDQGGRGKKGGNGR